MGGDRLSQAQEFHAHLIPLDGVEGVRLEALAQSARRYAEHLALGEHPKVFNRLYVSMVEAGETGGMLAEILDRMFSRFCVGK